MGITDYNVRVTLRIPPKLHEALQKMAKSNYRSLNSQIITLLQQANESKTKDER